MSDTVAQTGTELKALKDFSLSDWSVRKEVESVARMVRQLNNSINDTVMTARSLASGNWEASKYYADRTVNPDRYYDADGLRLDANGSGQKMDYADEWYRNQLDGKSNDDLMRRNGYTVPQQGGSAIEMPPSYALGGAAPANTVNNTTSNSGNVTNNITIQQQPGESSQDLANRVASAYGATPSSNYSMSDLSRSAAR